MRFLWCGYPSSRVVAWLTSRAGCSLGGASHTASARSLAADARARPTQHYFRSTRCQKSRIPKHQRNRDLTPLTLARSRLTYCRSHSLKRLLTISRMVAVILIDKQLFSHKQNTSWLEGFVVDAIKLSIILIILCFLSIPTIIFK